MGTTSQKLTYLNTTKQLLKTEINKINNVLDDNSTFRSYPQELFNGYLDILNNGTDTLWSNLEKVSASGEEATLENVETAPMKMVLNGNTSQETTTGKNLFTGLIKNVRLDPNNGEEFSGSTGATTDFIPVNINSNISYYLSGLVDTIRSFTCAYNSNKEFLGRTSAQTVSEKALTVGSFTAGTPTGTGDIAYIRITQYIQGEGTIDIIDGAKMQLEQGSTATSYEPYTGGIPSPNPDYPQEVKVVKGENVVSVSGKNLLNVPNTFSVTTSANITASLNAGTYTISLEDYETNVEVGSSFLFQFLKDNTLVTDAYLNMSYKKTTKAIPSEVDKIRIYASSSYNNSNGKTTTFKNLMIEQNSTVTPYVPYSKTDYPISLGTIEMCKIGNYKDFPFKAINGNEYYDTLTAEQKNALVYGKWYVHKEIGKVVLDGTEANWTYYVETSKPIFYCSFTGFKQGFNLLCYCDYYKGVGQKTNYSDLYDLGNNVIMLRANLPRIAIRDDRFTSINDFKTWLSNNNVTLYYILATPTEEEITNTTLISQLEAIANAKSVKDKTYITQTNDSLPFILDVEAIKEYEVN